MGTYRYVGPAAGVVVNGKTALRDGDPIELTDDEVEGLPDHHWAKATATRSRPAAKTEDTTPEPDAAPAEEDESA